MHNYRSDFPVWEAEGGGCVVAGGGAGVGSVVVSDAPCRGPNFVTARGKTYTFYILSVEFNINIICILSLYIVFVDICYQIIEIHCLNILIISLICSMLCTYIAVYLTFLILSEQSCLFFFCIYRCILYLHVLHFESVNLGVFIIHTFVSPDDWEKIDSDI